MEVVLQDLASLPEETVLSVRAGATRRQAPVSAMKDDALRFRFPQNLATCEPLKIDVLKPVATQRLVLQPDQSDYRMEFGLQGGDSVGFAIHVRSEPEMPGAAASFPEPPPSRAGCTVEAHLSYQDAAHNAKSYLENHNILPYIQSLLYAVIQDKPGDPFRFMWAQLGILLHEGAGAQPAAADAGCSQAAAARSAEEQLAAPEQERGVALSAEALRESAAPSLQEAGASEEALPSAPPPALPPPPGEEAAPASAPQMRGSGDSPEVPASTGDNAAATSAPLRRGTSDGGGSLAFSEASLPESPAPPAHPAAEQRSAGEPTVESLRAIVRSTLLEAARDGRLERVLSSPLRVAPESEQAAPPPNSSAQGVAQDVAQDWPVGTLEAEAELVDVEPEEEVSPLPRKGIPGVLRSIPTHEAAAMGYDEQWDLLLPEVVGEREEPLAAVRHVCSAAQAQDLGMDVDAAAAGSGEADGEGSRGTREIERLRERVRDGLSQVARDGTLAHLLQTVAMSPEFIQATDAASTVLPPFTQTDHAASGIVCARQPEVPSSDVSGLHLATDAASTVMPPFTETDLGASAVVCAVQPEARPPAHAAPPQLEPTPPAKPPASRKGNGRKAMLQRFSELQKNLDSLHEDNEKLQVEVKRIETDMRGVHEFNASVAARIGAEDVNQLLATVGHARAV